MQRRWYWIRTLTQLLLYLCFLVLNTHVHNFLTFPSVSTDFHLKNLANYTVEDTSGCVKRCISFTGIQNEVLPLETKIKIPELSSVLARAKTGAVLLICFAQKLQTGNFSSFWCACDSFHLHWSHCCFSNYTLYILFLFFFSFWRLVIDFKILTSSTLQLF